jgi:hypothetical protein
MPLLDTHEAIGAVTELVKTRISARLNNLNVMVGWPETAAAGIAGRKLNLFLYRLGIDSSLRNVSLDEGQPPPLWMVLHYLLTAYDNNRESDSIDAHRLLGRALAVLHELNYAKPAATDTALVPNPEPLKITFDEADVELLSKLMQGTDVHYRVSAAFQVRPVLIAPDSTPQYAPLVLTVGPPAQQGVVVLPSLGARLAALEPERFEAGDALTLRGSDLAGNTEVWIGEQSFPATPGPDRTLTTTVPLATTLAAGPYPVSVARVLPSGRRMTSNAVLGHLAPTVTGLAVAKPLAATAAGLLHGVLTIDGRRLGGPEDAIFVSLYRDGEVQLMLEAAGSASQTQLVATVPANRALAAGEYFLILRVNGEQATAAPSIDWT